MTDCHLESTLLVTTLPARVPSQMLTPNAGRPRSMLVCMGVGMPEPRGLCLYGIQLAGLHPVSVHPVHARARTRSPHGLPRAELRSRLHHQSQSTTVPCTTHQPSGQRQPAEPVMQFPAAVSPALEPGCRWVAAMWKTRRRNRIPRCPG